MFSTTHSRLSGILYIILVLACAGCGGYTAGNLALAKGDFQRAESLFQELLAENPEDTTARRRLAMTYFTMGRDVDASYYAQSVAQFRAIAKYRAPTPEEQFYHGLALIGQGLRSQGFALLKQLTHPTQFRTQQSVRERAAQLESHTAYPAREIFAQMERAWRKGEEEDKREQQEDREEILNAP
jgi:tetratricopeptide (TPR) repeat protein